VVTVDAQREPSVAVDDTGAFVVAWTDYQLDGSNGGIFVRRFTSGGVPLGAARDHRLRRPGRSRRHHRNRGEDRDERDHPPRRDGAGGSDVFTPSGAVDGAAIVSPGSMLSQGGRMRSVAAGVVTALAVISSLASTAGSARAQSPVPIGSEFQVNTYTTNQQYLPAVGMDANGNFVVTWYSAEDGSLFGIFARRYNSSGVALGAPFQINTYTTESQRNPSIDLDPDGDFVIAWQSTGQDGSANGVFARRFASTGAPLTGEIPVNSTTAEAQTAPAVAVEPDGDFVVAWHSNLQDGDGSGVFARRFASSGSPLAGEFRANSFTPGGQRYASVDREPDGDFIVTWASDAQDGSGVGIFGQRFNSTGGALGPEFQVNTRFTNDQRYPSVRVDADGDFVVAWENELGPGDFEIRARRFNSSGTPQGTEFPVSTESGVALLPRVATDADGDFVIAWWGETTGVEYGIYMRRFKASGVAQNVNTLANTTTNGIRSFAAVATDPGGDFVVVWNATDGDSFGVFGRRFISVSIIDVDGDGQFLPLTDGLLVLRFAFGFTGNTLITGAVGGGCTRCDAPSITAYLQSLL
jgi:hypothetical protein